MSKNEVEELVQQCRELGWKVEDTTKGFYKLLPKGGGDPIITPRSGNGRALGNFKAELRRAGFNPEAIEAAKAERAAAALNADRRKNEAALALAAQRAAQRTTEAAYAPAQPVLAPQAPVKPTVTSPFAPPTPVVQNRTFESGKLNALAGYPREDVRITQKQAAGILAYAKEQQALPDGCRQRKLNRKNKAKLQQAMEMGEWELNPGDSLVFCKEHKSIVNGQHRMEALVGADSEFVEAFYPPEGLPFAVTYDFPCDQSHILDTGKSRDTADTLTAARLEGWGPLQSAALRLAMQYDQSFEEDGNTAWTTWRRITHTGTEFTNSAKAEYGALLDNHRLVSRAYSRSKVTRSAAMVALFLFERDNPKGNPKLKRTNELFWKGVCDDDDMTVGDARRAVIRVAARTGAKFRVDNGPLMLAYLLKGYAKYMSGKKIELLGTPDQMKELPMLPVWTPQLKWDGQLLVPREE